MVQMSGIAGDEGTVDPKVSKTGRAVLVLALFVVLSVVLLHELDNAPAQFATEAKAAAVAQQAIIPLTSTTLQPRSPADLKVLVANGVGTAGAASKVAARLQPLGYQLAKPGNTTDKQINSAVMYAPGYQAEAQAVATSLGIAASSVQELTNPSPVADMQASTILVIVGNDLAAAPAAGSTAGTTATTSALSNGPLTSGSLTTLSTATTLPQ